MADFTGFPICQNGDVLIVLSTDRRLQLHSEILKRHSRFFGNNLSDSNAMEPCNAAKKAGITYRWRFDLQYASNSPDGDIGKLEQVLIDNMGRSITSNTASSYYGGGKMPVNVFGYYEKVLGAIYNRPLELTREDMTLLLSEVMGIVDISEYLGCMHVVARTVDSILVEYAQLLYRSIASSPVAWGSLAMRIKSYNIVREAIIHLVGQWKMIPTTQKEGIPPKLRDVVDAKLEQLETLKIKTEMKMASFYLPSMEHDFTGVAKDVGRASYANDIMDWMVNSLFRQFLSTVFIRNMGHGAADGGYQFYALIHAGGHNYLSRDDLNKFHDKFKMTSRGERNYETRMNVLKEALKELVAPLFKNASNLNMVENPCPYLTCMDFPREELPRLWNEDPNLQWQAPTSVQNLASNMVHDRRMPALQMLAQQGGQYGNQFGAQFGNQHGNQFGNQFAGSNRARQAARANPNSPVLGSRVSPAKTSSTLGYDLGNLSKPVSHAMHAPKGIENRRPGQPLLVVPAAPNGGNADVIMGSPANTAASEACGGNKRLAEDAKVESAKKARQD